MEVTGQLYIQAGERAPKRVGGPHSQSERNGEEKIMYLSKEFVLAPYIGLHGVMLD
jgi:hypothetical protein